jgi:hypothetical protein
VRCDCNMSVALRPLRSLMGFELLWRFIGS